MDADHVWIMQQDGTMVRAPEDDPVRKFIESDHEWSIEGLSDGGYSWVEAFPVYGEADAILSTGLHLCTREEDAFPWFFVEWSESTLIGVVVCYDYPSYVAARRVLYPSLMVQRLSFIIDTLERKCKEGASDGRRRRDFPGVLSDILVDAWRDR